MQLIRTFAFASLILAASAAHRDPIPHGPDFMTCGCLDGTIVEFCGGPCEVVQAACKEACRGYGYGTLFTACAPGGCP